MSQHSEEVNDGTYRTVVNIVAIVASAAFAGGGLLVLVFHGVRVAIALCVPVFALLAMLKPMERATT